MEGVIIIMKELQCLLCNQWFNHLGSHIAKRHKILAKDYKMQFGLSINHALISKTIKLKKQIAFSEDREKYLANIKKAGKKYQFKKGKVGNKNYYSDESIELAIKRLDEINSRKEENCPFCNLKTKHKESHIFNAHGYLKVSRKN